MHPSSESGGPRLLDRVRAEIRSRHYSLRTEQSYLQWVRRYLRFHRLKHPREMGEDEVRAFLSSLAVDRQVSASTQNQALAALMFLYRDVLDQPVGWLDNIVRAKRPRHLPVVLSQKEVAAILDRLRDVGWLAVSLLYGSGLRLNECLSLRVKDLDMDRAEIVVRHGKGGKDRPVPLPATVAHELTRHLERVKSVHDRDLAAGHGRVVLPFALARKCPAADREWA